MKTVDAWTTHPARQRTGMPRCVVIHTTADPNIEKVLSYYRSGDPQGKDVQPHYLISDSGIVYRIVPEDHVAQHAGRKPVEDELYAKGYQHWSEWHWERDAPAPVNTGGEFSGYHDWRETWHTGGLESPLDLATALHPNAASIGVELLEPKHPPAAGFTDAQYSSLAELLGEIWMRQHVPLTRSTVLTHYEVSPLRRSNTHGSTDPGRAFSFAKLWALMRPGRKP